VFGFEHAIEGSSSWVVRRFEKGRPSKTQDGERYSRNEEGISWGWEV
jgi:hypothetical protein